MIPCQWSGADQQGVDVLAFDQLAEIVVRLAARVRAAIRPLGVERVDPPLPGLEAGLPAVAHGDDLAEGDCITPFMSSVPGCPGRSRPR